MATIAQYTYDSTQGTILPTFNNGFSYSTSTSTSGTTVTMTITANSAPTSMSFQNSNIQKVLTLDTSKLTKMDYMFDGCALLTQVDCTNWNTNNVTSLLGVFRGCSKLTTLTNIGNINTNNVTIFKDAFYGCASLTTLNLSGWNFTKTDSSNYVYMMCAYCIKLKTLNLGNFSTNTSVTYQHYIFQSSPSLRTITLTCNNSYALASFFNDLPDITPEIGIINLTTTLSSISTTTTTKKGWTVNKQTKSKICLGSTILSNIYKGTTEITKVYLGTTLIYEKSSSGGGSSGSSIPCTGLSISPSIVFIYYSRQTYADITCTLTPSNTTDKITASTNSTNYIAVSTPKKNVVRVTQLVSYPVGESLVVTIQCGSKFQKLEVWCEA